MADKTIPGYRVVVTGTYIATNEHGVKTKRFYKGESFDLPKVVSYKNGMHEIEIEVDGQTRTKVVPNIIKENASRGNVALHIIRRFHIEDRLKEKHEDYVSTKTCEVFSKEPYDIPVNAGGDIVSKPVKDMSLSELKQFVDLSDLNVILGDYYDLGDKKMAVMKAKEQKHKDEVAAGRSPHSLEEERLQEPDSALFG